MSQLRERPGDQPLPTEGQQDVSAAVIVDVESSTQNSAAEVDRVRADFAARIELGISRYGHSLQTHNGRDALLDCYQEVLDAAHYAKQWHLETKLPRAQLAYWSLLQLCFDLRSMMAESTRRTA